MNNWTIGCRGCVSGCGLCNNSSRIVKLTCTCCYMRTIDDVSILTKGNFTLLSNWRKN